MGDLPGLGASTSRIEHRALASSANGLAELRRSSRRAGESDSAFAPVIVEAAAPCADVSTGRPLGPPVIDIVIGAAMIRIPPYAVALTTCYTPTRMAMRSRLRGNPIQQEAFNYGLFRLSKIIAEAR